MQTSDLTGRHCRPCGDGESPLAADRANELLDCLHRDWNIDASGREISRTFAFRNYYQTMAFVNALAWIAHAEDHHPDIEAGYNRCHVRYSTHAIGGLSENDFICAARIDALLPEQS
jgi:4a-hydroxytetrahydrobiopterin dehydratase